MLLLLLVLAADGIDLEKTMGSDIYAAAGLHKLSDKERGVLSRWLLVYTARAPAKAQTHSAKLHDLLDAVIVASDGHTLGKISRDPMDEESIANELGRFGKRFGAESIMSKHSPYGDMLSETSALCPTASAPPRIFVGTQMVAWLTVNPQLKPRVDTLDLFKFLQVHQ